MISASNIHKYIHFLYETNYYTTFSARFCTPKKIKQAVNSTIAVVCWYLVKTPRVSHVKYIHLARPVGKILALDWVASLIWEPSVAFARQQPWSSYIGYLGKICAIPSRSYLLKYTVNASNNH